MLPFGPKGFCTFRNIHKASAKCQSSDEDKTTLSTFHAKQNRLFQEGTC